MNVSKAYEITDAKIKFVSLVDKAANLKKFLITKAEAGKATFTTYGRIVKADNENHYVTGIVYEPMVEDAHGNYMDAEEITKAAYYFAKSGGEVDLQHSFEPLDGATVVESWIAKADFQIGDEAVKKGTWLMTMEIDNQKIWDAIEKGEITGFSMGGVGVYSEEDVKLDNVEKTAASAVKSEEQSEKKGVFKKLAEMLGFDVVEKSVLVDKPIKKAGKKMSNANRATLQSAYDALGVLLEAVTDITPEEEEEDKGKPESKPEDRTKDKGEDEDKVEKPDESKDAPKSKKPTSDEDEENKDDEEEKNLTKAEVEKLLQDTVTEAVTKALGEQQNEPQPDETATKDMVQEMVTKAVAEAIAPVLKARGVPSAMNDGANEPQPVEKHYLHGIL